MLLSAQAYAFELIMIQAVSDTKTTFITRNGKRQGVIRGVTGTFTAEDVAVLAKAITVTGEFTQWEVINPNTRLPFEKGAIVTYYPATEYVWALAPEADRRKHIRSEMPDPRSSLVFRGAISRGVQETVSGTAAGEANRGGYSGDILFERDLFNSFSFDVGLRYEREVVNYEGTSFVTKRNLILADVLYYFRNLQEYIPGKVFIGLGIGYGISGTSTVGVKQSGQVGLLPAVKAGITYPFDDQFDFIFDLGFESLQTSEEQADATSQTTTQTNFKTAIGLRRFF